MDERGSPEWNEACNLEQPCSHLKMLGMDGNAQCRSVRSALHEATLARRPANMATKARNEGRYIDGPSCDGHQTAGVSTDRKHERV